MRAVYRRVLQLLSFLLITTSSLTLALQQSLKRLSLQRAQPIYLKCTLNGYLLREIGLPQLPAQPAISISIPKFHPPNLTKFIAKKLPKIGVLDRIKETFPLPIQDILTILYPEDLILLLLFRTAYDRLLHFAHRAQIILWKAANLDPPNKWNRSILGFMYERSHLLSQLITFNYCAKVSCAVLTRLGLHIRPDLPQLLSRLSYALFLSHFADLFKTQFLRTFFPKVGESKRQSYIIDKSASVAIWTIGGLVACEMVSTYLKVPLSSTLAFGGVGGLAVGLSLRDIAANFMGGMMLLFNEPFTPGDTVSFQSGTTEVKTQ